MTFINMQLFATHSIVKNYKSELYVVYEPQYAMFNEWLKQLYGESEGKEKKGLFPTSVTFSLIYIA